MENMEGIIHIAYAIMNSMENLHFDKDQDYFHILVL